VGTNKQRKGRKLSPVSLVRQNNSIFAVKKRKKKNKNPVRQANYRNVGRPEPGPWGTVMIEAATFTGAKMKICAHKVNVGKERKQQMPCRSKVAQNAEIHRHL